MVMRCWQLKGISSNLGVSKLTLSLRPGAGLVVHLADFDENWVGGTVALWIGVSQDSGRVLLHLAFLLAFFHRFLSSASCTLNNGRGVPKSRLAEKCF